MIDKIQKIRKEVARIQLYTQSEVLKQVLDYIDEVQKEPVSEELLDTTQTITYKGEVYTRCYKDKLDAFACKYPMSVPKPSKRYAKYSDVDLTIAIKEGAKWQYEQFENNRLAACDRQTKEEAEIEMNFVTSIIEKEHRLPTYDDAIKYGMELKEQQMMNNAVDACVTGLRGYKEENEVDFTVMQKRVDFSYAIDDEVKLIIIKDEQL